jgi:hypothetical protein
VTGIGYDDGDRIGGSEHSSGRARQRDLRIGGGLEGAQIAAGSLGTAHATSVDSVAADFRVVAVRAAGVQRGTAGEQGHRFAEPAVGRQRREPGVGGGRRGALEGAAAAGAEEDVRADTGGESAFDAVDGRAGPREDRVFRDEGGVLAHRHSRACRGEVVGDGAVVDVQRRFDDAAHTDGAAFGGFVGRECGIDQIAALAFADDGQGSSLIFGGVLAHRRAEHAELLAFDIDRAAIAPAVGGEDAAEDHQP